MFSQHSFSSQGGLVSPRLISILKSGINCGFSVGKEDTPGTIAGTTIQLEFTPEILNELKYQRFRHFVPLVQRSMEAVLLKAHNLPHALIAELVGVTEYIQ